MSRVHITGGVLNVADAGEIDNSLPGGGHIDNSLPGGFPPIGSTLPEPPPGVWPPITGWAPIQPAPPGTPPGVIWPPVHPPHPGHGLPTPPSGTLPVQPGHPSGQPLPTPPGATLPVEPSKTFWVVCGIPGVGWRYTTVDPSLSVGYPLPPAPAPK